MASTDNDNNNVGPSFIKPGKEEYVHPEECYIKFALGHIYTPSTSHCCQAVV